ncbi:MAG: hypothetical protein CL913_00535 [Deltaproteobacteria bacterium]|nr:hypothetical protein [Deltaproteobacteria bacterium]
MDSLKLPHRLANPALAKLASLGSGGRFSTRQNLKRQIVTHFVHKKFEHLIEHLDNSTAADVFIKPHKLFQELYTKSKLVSPWGYFNVWVCRWGKVGPDWI